MTDRKWQAIHDEDCEQTKAMLNSFIEEISTLEPENKRVWIQPIRELVFEALLDIRRQKRDINEGKS